MKKIFVIQVEYPDNDVIPSEEVMEVTQECIEHYMELHFGANIMDGDYARIKVKEVTNGFSLVKRMREAQIHRNDINTTFENFTQLAEADKKQDILEKAVDKWLEENL